MALQVWLPLNGDLTNIGLSDVTVTNGGATVNASGKIGSCYSFDGNDDYIRIDCPLFPTWFASDFSVAFWVYNNDSGGRAIYFGNWGLTGQWMNIEKTTGEKLRFYWNDGHPDYNPSNTYSPVGEWTHVVFTKQGDVASFYTNGVLTDTLNYTSGMSQAVPSTATFFFLGRDARTGTTAFNGRMNDFRIYDHALSSKEIKELSKGLVLHYPLNDLIGNDNMLHLTNQGYHSYWNWSANGGSRTYETYEGNGVKMTTTTAANSGSWSCVTYNDATLKTLIEPDTKYTCSVDVYSNYPMSSMSCSIRNGNALNPITDQVTYRVPANTWIHAVWTLTSTSDVTNVSQVLYFAGTPPTTAVGNMMIFKNLKFEKGEVATGWVPNTTDAAYTAMGFDDRTIYDCSGYGHNGTESANPPVVYAESSRYSSCMKFNGSNNYLMLGKDGMVRDAITISLWAYKDNWSISSGSQTIASCTESGGFSFGINTSNLVLYMGTGESSNTYKTVNVAISNLSTGWNMLTGTYDGISAKVYINGVYKNKSADLSTKTPVYYNTSTQILIGAEPNNSGNPTGNYFDGLVSDFRIYATALSADDIKELYEVSASIDNNGNVYGNEYVEE